MTTTRMWPLSVATLPLWAILWLLLAASVARAKLGHWRIYNQPDPYNILPVLVDFPVWPFILAAPLALLTSLVIAFHGRYVGRGGWRNVVVVAVVSFLLLLCWLWFDPGGFFEWWID
jgi:hypothetical protein